MGASRRTLFFILLNEAHEVLSDETKRIPYDQQYLSWKKGNSEAKNFHYDWDSFNKLQGRRKRNVSPPKLWMQLLFGLETFTGFLEAFLLLGAIFKGALHPVYAVCAIPGVLLVVDGWKGFLGRLSVLGGLVKAVRKLL